MSALHLRPGHSVGAEYGEGFASFRRGGDAVDLSVDRLNEVLSPTGAARLRHALKPDEAHGAIFSFEGVLADTRSAQLAAWDAVAAAAASSAGPLAARPAWEAVAAAAGRAPPSAGALAARPALLTLAPHAAALELGWTRDIGEARAIGAAVAAAYVQAVSELCAPRPGVARWLAALAAAGVPVAAVSSLDAATLRAALRRMGLPSLAPAAASAGDGDTAAHRLLAAALKLGRPPRSCVAFVPCRASVAAAHNASMRAVGVAGAGARPADLAAADATVLRLDELSVINIRRLFAAAGTEGGPWMDLARERGGGEARRPPPRVSGGLA